MKYEVGESSAIKGKAKALDVYVDGRKMRKLIMLPRETHYTVDGVRTSDNVMRRFMFADIRTTGVNHPPFPTILPCLVCTGLSRRRLSLWRYPRKSG